MDVDICNSKEQNNVPDLVLEHKTRCDGHLVTFSKQNSSLEGNSRGAEIKHVCKSTTHVVTQKLKEQNRKRPANSPAAVMDPGSFRDSSHDKLLAQLIGIKNLVYFDACIE